MAGGMNSKLLSACALAALTVTATAGTAHAESEEAAKRRKANFRGNMFGYYVDDLQTLRSEGTSSNLTPAECYQNIELAHGEGFADTDLLLSRAFERYPGAEGGATKDPESSLWRAPLSTMKRLCDEYAKELALVEKVAALKDHFDLGLATYTMSIEELSKLGGADDPANWDKDIAAGQKCLADADAIIASGVAPDRPVRIRHIEPFTLDGFKKNVCQRYIDWATTNKVEVPKFAKERQARIEAKFKKVGIKGKRLELFAYYDQEWYLPGCERATADPKVLKKQKRLFQWFTGPGGEITIRKYTFKGDNYTTSEKTTYNETQAYKLCR
jgi:hypothetical protein